MPESTTQLLQKAEEALEKGFRYQLLSRGAARALVWKNGNLPVDGAPAFSQMLSHDLAMYGFGMLDLGLELRDRGDRSETCYRVFEAASRAIESILVNGPQEFPERNFYATMAAAAAHIGRFSARAASLLTKVPSDHGSGEMSVLLAMNLLMRRKLDVLRNLCLDELLDPEAWDNWATEGLKSGKFTAEPIASSFLKTSILRGAGEFGTALVTGEEYSFSKAIVRLVEAEGLALQFNHPVYWWVARVTRNLIDDLWGLTLHKQLPIQPTGASPYWDQWRRAFISILAARSSAEVELWPSQIEPIQNVFHHPHLVAALPTSAGKTRIAEIAILWALSLNQKVIFVTPLRALSAQTERSLARLFEPLGMKITSFYSGSGLTAGEANMLNESNITVCTPEKLDFALRNQPDLLDTVGCVVLDEGHMLGTNEREIRYEVLIQRLTKLKGASTRRLVCLSAMLPTGDTTEDFAAWLGNDQPCPVYAKPWKPTRRIVGEINWDEARRCGDYTADCNGTPTFLKRFITETVVGRSSFPSKNLEFTLACASRLIGEGRSVMIYCAQRTEVEQIAKGFVASVRNNWIPQFPVTDPVLLESELSFVSEWLPEDHPVFQALRYGLATHHAQLPRPIQLLVEELLRKKIVSAVVSSPTLAQGLNLSASCLLFHSVQRRPTGRPVDIGGDEIANVAGRAGRAFVDIEGLVLGMGFSDSQRRAWQRLKGNAVAGQATIESGLLLIIEMLLKRIHAKAADGDVGLWTLSHSPLGELPSDDAGEQEEARSWDLLDMALLALIGDNNVSTVDLPSVLDEVLRDSYLRRRLARLTQERAIAINAILVNRAVRIWSNTTQASRAAWHRAGVGVETGLNLEAEFGLLASAVSRAHTAIEETDKESFVEAVAQLAEIIWKIPPFSPYSPPAESLDILKEWLRGTLGRDIMALNSKAMNFVEDAIIYRLTWGVEAVRLMAIALADDRFSDDPSPILPRLEHGLFEQTAVSFRQAGISSRITCIALSRCFRQSLENVSKVHEWIDSSNAIECSKNTLFPTPETHQIWRRFWDQSLVRNNDRRRIVTLNLKNPLDKPLPSGTIVAHSHGGSTWKLRCPDLTSLGIGISDENHEPGLFAYGFVNNGIATVSFWTGPDE